MPEQMTHEEFTETFATDSSRDLANGGVIYYGKALGKSEIDIMFCKPPEYEAAWGWCLESYRMIFIDLEGRSIITYCEGDITVTIHRTQEAFDGELLSARRFYDKPRYMDRDYDESKPNSHADPEGEKLVITRENFLSD